MKRFFVAYLFSLIGVLSSVSTYAESEDSKQEEPTFIQDLSKKLMPHALEMFPNIPGTPAQLQEKVHTIKKDGAFLVETAQSVEEKVHEGLRDGDSPNVYRDALVNALVEMSIIASLPYKPLISVSEIGDVASTHFEKSRTPVSDRDRLISSLAYMGEMTSAMSPEMTKIASEECVSQLLKVTALPKRVIHTVSDYLTKKYIAHAADYVGVTDANSKKVLDWMGDIAVDVHSSMLKAPDRIKEMYVDWSKEINRGIKVIKYAGGKNTAQTTSESTAHFAFTEEEKSYIAKNAVGHMAQLEKQMSAYNSLNEDARAQELDKQPDTESFRDYVHQIRQFNFFRDTTIDVFDGLAAISHIAGNRHTAEKLQTFGHAAASIVTHMHTLTTSQPALASLFKVTASASTSAIHPYVGIAMATASLLSIFGDDEDQGSAIMEALAQGIAMLSKQIHQLHERFDGLERQLDAQHRSVMYAFFQLYQQQGDLVKGIQSIYRDLIAETTLIKGSLENLSTMQALHHQEISAQFSSLRLEALDDLVADITADIERGMTAEKFILHVQELNKKVMITAKSAPMTGASITPINYQRIQEVFDYNNDFDDTIYSHPAFDHINLLKKYTDLHCSSMNTSDKGVHPLIWIRAVQALIALVEQAIDHKIAFKDPADKIVLLKNIQEIINAGKETIKVVERSYDSSCVQVLFDDCAASIKSIAELTELYKKEYLDNALKKEMIDRVKKVADEDIALFALMPPLEFDALKSRLTRIANILDATAFPCNGEAYSLDSQTKELCRWVDDPKIIEQKKAAYRMHSMEVKKAIIRHSEEAITYLREIGDIHVDKFQRSKPLSMILYPQDSDLHHRILVDPTMTIDPVYSMAELIGVGSLRAEYALENNRFYRRIYFITDSSKDVVQESWVSYDLDSIHDEAIYDFWYGGRYVKPQDFYYTRLINGPLALTWNSITKCCEGEKIYYPPVIPYDGVSVTFSQKAQHSTYDVQVLSKVKNLIKQKVINYHKKVHQKIIEEISSHSDSLPLSVVVQKYDAQSKMLEALLVLGYNEQIMHDPAFKELISNNSGTLKNRNALVRHFEQHKTDQDRFMAQGNSTEYLPIETTLTAYDLAHEATRNKDNQKFVLVSELLAKLQDLTAEVKDIPVQAVVQENGNIPKCVSYDVVKQRDREIAELKEGNAATQQKLEAIQQQLSLIMSLLQHRGQQEKIKI